MCYNVMDGRYHTLCNHFVPMSTSFKDCLQANCLFSRNHIHAAACACKSATCIRLMAVPVRNPIRISSGICAGCALNNREDLKRPLPTATPGPMRV